MKKIITCLLFLVCTSNYNVIAQTDSVSFTIYLIRHSEKDIFSENQTDPPLTECGKKRSESLRFFSDLSKSIIESLILKENMVKHCKNQLFFHVV